MFTNDSIAFTDKLKKCLNYQHLNLGCKWAQLGSFEMPADVP